MNLAAVQEVRNRSFAPLNECKSALQEANGDVEGALVVLQKRGVLRAAASASRDAREGLVRSYVHNGKIAVLVEVSCETDFAARNPLFVKFVDDLAMHVAAAGPRYLSRDDLAAQDLRAAYEIAKSGIPSGKPEAVLEKIVAGKMEKFYAETCLVDQTSLIAQNGKTIEQLRAELSSQLGENVVVRRFMRWELGDTLPKQVDPRSVTRVC
jgi:elongation factor Ts